MSESKLGQQVTGRVLHCVCGITIQRVALPQPSSQPAAGYSGQLPASVSGRGCDWFLPEVHWILKATKLNTGD